ncbi:MAG: tetratricopeptide repeat protein, partial [Bacteroidia bacterium]
RSLKISQSLKDKLDEASDYNNLATAYNLTGNKTKALDCYTLGLQIDEEIGDKEGIALLLNNIGEYYTTQKDVKTAIDYFERSLKISKEIGKVLQIQDASQNLYQAFKLTHRDREALAMHELFIQMRDSINSETSKKEIIRQEFKYEYEKKEEAVRVRAMEEKKVVDAHFAQEKTQRYVLYSGGLLLLVFGSFMFKRFRVTQKQKIIIEKQKDLVEEKQKEVLDSIHYAGRIQKSLLPTERYIDKNLKRLIR